MIKLMGISALTIGAFISLYLLWGLLQQLFESELVNRWCHRFITGMPQGLQNNLQSRWLRSQHYEETGSAQPTTIERWLMQRILIVLAVIVWLVVPQPQSIRFVVCTVFGCWLFQRLNKRRQWLAQIERQWPATLDIYAMLLLSGLSQRAAIYEMARLPNPSRATWLIQRLQHDLQAGTDLERALERLAQFQNSGWIPHFVTASIQSLKYGSQLAETLLNQADQARQQQIVEAEKRAQEVGVKLLFPLLLCFFPVTFLIILGPLFLRFLHGGW